MRNMGHDITDRNLVRCDICDDPGENSKGGVAMIEKKGSFASQTGPTMSCSRCFDEFTCALPGKRMCRPNTRQSSALRFGIGVDPEWYYKLDESKDFRDNVLELRKNPRKFEDGSIVGIPWKCSVKMDSNSNSNPKIIPLEKDAEIAYPLYATCLGCKEPKPIYDLKRCGKCRLARYCSVDCQKTDWKLGHKDFCQK